MEAEASRNRARPAGTREWKPARRWVAHVDMDAFFASVEQLDDPSLAGLPLVVANSPLPMHKLRQMAEEAAGLARPPDLLKGVRGVVSSASYAARAFGVRSAMPSVTAKRLCPDLIFIKPRFDAYRAVSQQIRAIFADYTPHVEPLSLDEAYLDVTEDLRGIGIATRIAEEIRARIRAETGLTASAGVSYNKFIAKLASDQNKPDGLCVITPERGPEFVASLPVARFHGVGPVTAQKMERLGIVTGADLQAWSLPQLEAHFGSSGAWYWRIAQGIDDREVKPDRPYKSVSAERTFDDDVRDPDRLSAELARIAGYAWARVERAEVAGRTVTLKVKYADFELITRSKSLPAPVCDEAAFLAVGQTLLGSLYPLPKGIRLLGLGLHNLTQAEGEPPAQLGFAI